MKKSLIALLITLIAVSAGCSSESKKVQADKATAEDYISVFKDANIPIGKTINYSADKDPEASQRPGMPVQELNWADTRVSQPEDDVEEVKSELSDDEYKEAMEEAKDSVTGGLIEIFKSPDEALKRKSEIESANNNKNSKQYLFTHEKALIRVDGGLTAEQVADYEKALRSLD